MPAYRKPGVSDGPSANHQRATGMFAAMRDRFIGGRAHSSGDSLDPMGTWVSHPLTIDPDIEKAHEVGIHLYEMSLRLVGFPDPPKIFEGDKAIERLSNGRWLDDVIAGKVMVPHIGDLARHGQLIQFKRTVEDAIRLCEKSRRCLELLLPGMKRLDQVLRLFAPGTYLPLDQIMEIAARMVMRYGGQLEPILPDIRQHFRFNELDHNGLILKIGFGRLGVPGKVRPDGNLSTRLSGGTQVGDRTGHMFGARFGTPRAINPTPEQDWRAANGTNYLDLEQRWDEYLQTGWGIEAKLTDLTRLGEDRPYERLAEWTEINPNGSRLVRQMRFKNAVDPKPGETTKQGQDSTRKPLDSKDLRGGNAPGRNGPTTNGSSQKPRG